MIIEIRQGRGRTLAGVRLVLAGMAASLAAAPLAAGAASDSTWEQWRTVAGVYDLGGPRSDGSLLIAGSPNLYLADPAGNLTPFPTGSGGYHPDPGAEAYLAVSPGLHVEAAACDFAQDETFLLRVRAPLGIDRVDAAGQNVGSFASVGGVGSLSGIAFDATGAFDHRLLVSGGGPGGKTVIAAIDCRGSVQPITTSAPTLEGGLAVAPPGFGSFAGDLVAPDELSGNLYAIAPNGTVTTIGNPGLSRGGDIGVESLGFIPTGFMRGGSAYYADRNTPGNPHPGTDSVLRLSSSDLAAAGVREGDLLVATEGGAALIGVHCETSCSVNLVVRMPTTAHGEGHIAFTIDKTAATPTTAPRASPKPAVAQPSSSTSRAGTLALVIAVVVVVAAAALFLGRWRS